MSDLKDDLRRYIDYLAETVARETPPAVHRGGRPRPRWPVFVGAAAALALVAVAALALLDLGGEPPNGVETEAPRSIEEDVGVLHGKWTELPTTLGRQDFSTSLFWTGEELIAIYPENLGTEVTGEIYQPGDGGGSIRPVAPSGLDWRSSPAIVWTGSDVILAGGSTGGIQTGPDAAAYNPDTDTWRPLPSPPRSGDDAVVGPAVWTGEEMVVWRAGLAYNPSTEAWRTIAPAPLQDRQDAAVVGVDGKVFVWGGCAATNVSCDDAIDGDEYTDGAIYDPAADEWSMLATSPLGVGNHPVAVFTDAEVVVVMSDPADDATSTAAYNPSTDSWRTLPSSPQPGGQVASAWTGRYVVLHGGGTQVGETTALDPSTGQWYRLPPGPGRDRHAAVWAGDRLFVAGGYPPGPPWQFEFSQAEQGLDGGSNE